MAIDIYEHYRPKVEAIARKYGVDERLFTKEPDVVMVVRCKDCQHSSPAYRDEQGEFVSCYELCLHMHPDDYCSYGERME